MRYTFLLVVVLLYCWMGAGAQNAERVSAKLFYSLTQKQPKALIVDVRPPEKFAEYRIKDALPAPEKKDLIALSQVVPKSDTIFVYCEKDNRTDAAVAILDSLGYTNVIQLKGGLISWRRNRLPLDDSSR